MLNGVSFSPNDPPRLSEFLLTGDLPDTLPPLPHKDVELVGADGTLQTVRTVVLDIHAALDWLSALALDNEDPLVEAWSVATKLGIELIARGRLRPMVTRNGLDAWGVGPLDVADSQRLDELVKALPPQAYAVPIHGSSPVRLSAPRSVITNYWNAIADTLVRSPAAPGIVRYAAYVAAEPVDVEPLRSWLEDLSSGEAGPLRMGFRLEPPSEDDGKFAVAPYLQSTSDHSLTIDAADLWDAPPTLRRHFGEDAEAVMLRSLRRAARAWTPLAVLLEQERPDRLELTERDFDALLDTGSSQLAAVGFDVAWPREFTASPVSVRASLAGVTSPGSGRAKFDLSQALDLQWSATVDGQKLTEAEMRALVSAKRPIVRMRGRWVVVDKDTIEKLKSRKAREARDVQAGEALAGAMSGELIIDGELVDVEVDSVLHGIADRVRNYERQTSLPEPAGLKAELRPYQQRGLAWLNEMCELGIGGCLADDMGLGKTIQIIALHLYRAHLHQEGGPTLVVCPASLLGNWEREVARFAPEVRTHRFHGTKRSLEEVDKHDIVLVTYGVVRRDRATLGEREWDLVVADEAQHAKNPRSLTARSLRAIPGNVRFALTGTPVENQLTELWAILDWTTPGLLGQLEAFRRNVATPIERNHDKDAAAALSAVVRPFLLRRRKVDPEIAPELPRKTESDVFVPFTAEQASLYKAVTEEALDAIKSKEGIARKGLILKLLTALKQICNHPAQYLKQNGPLAQRSGKLAAFDELVDGTDESILVFSQYVQMGRLLESHLAAKGVSTLFLHGSVPPRKRDEMVEQFQAGEARVFLLSLKAGGTGLNLTRATHVIHYDRWWNPAVEDQATDRAYRIGQTQPVQVHRMVCEGTLEERIAALLRDKRELSESVIGSGEGWVSEFSDDELADLVMLS